LVRLKPDATGIAGRLKAEATGIAGRLKAKATGIAGPAEGGWHRYLSG
jgi:hypothetical protein